MMQSIHTIALVGNRTENNPDCSALVEACDLVVRVNKMCSLDGGCCGTRTDWAVVSAWRHYWTFPQERRHASLLPGLKRVFVFQQHMQGLTLSQRLEAATWRNKYIIPPCILQKARGFTTAATALCLLHDMYPQAVVYFAAQDKGDAWVAARRCVPHPGNEVDYYSRLEEQGVLIFPDAATSLPGR